MPGKLRRSPLANGPMNDGGHDAKGHSQPPDDIVTAPLVVQPATEPNAEKAADLITGNPPLAPLHPPLYGR